MPYNYSKRGYGHNPARKGKILVRGKKNYNKKKYKQKMMTKASFTRLKDVIGSDRLLTKLMYSQRVSLTSTAGAITSQLFSGNGLYDPDVSGTGSQPEGFDQMMALYGRYRVYSSKIKVDFINVGSTNATSAFEICIVPVPGNATGFTTMDDAKAAPYAKYGVYNIWNLQRISHYIGTEKIYGLHKNAVEIETTYAGTSASSPTLEWTWQIYVQSADRSSTATCYTYTTIEYYSEFFDRNQLQLS